MRDPNCLVCTPGLCEHGEQSDAELLELDRQIATAVKAERAGCVELVTEAIKNARSRCTPAEHFAVEHELLRLEVAIQARGGK